MSKVGGLLRYQSGNFGHYQAFLPYKCPKKLIKIHFILLFLGYLGKGLAVNQGRILSAGPPNDSYWPLRLTHGLHPFPRLCASASIFAEGKYGAQKPNKCH